MGPDGTDVRLHERLLAGDDDALAEVYDRWSPLVHTLAARITDDHGAAEEVTQDVFVHLWEHPETYDPARGALRSWLCMLARSRALDWIRRRRARLRYHASAAALLDCHTDELDEAVAWETAAKAVREAVRALPEPQRAAVLLAYYHGRTYREVARELEIPEGTAKSRLRVALATLATRLTAEGIVEAAPGGPVAHSVDQGRHAEQFGHAPGVSSLINAKRMLDRDRPSER